MYSNLNHYVDFLTDLPNVDVYEPLPGKELVEALAAGLDQRNVSILEIDEDETGHYITCQCEGHRFEIVFSPDTLSDKNRWGITAGPKQGKRKHFEHIEEQYKTLLFIIDETLRTLEGVRDVRWFSEFDNEEYLDIQIPSDGPIRDPNLDNRDPLPIRLNRKLNAIMVASQSYFYPFIIVCFFTFIILGNFSPLAFQVAFQVLALIMAIVVLAFFVVIPISLSIYTSIWISRAKKAEYKIASEAGMEENIDLNDSKDSG